VKIPPPVTAGVGPERLRPAERLLLAGLRTWARARVDGAAPHGYVQAGFASIASPRTAALFTAFMDRLERHCRRPLEVHLPCCPAYSADEQRLVLACGVCRVAEDIAERLLRPLIDDPIPLLALSRGLNASLASDGFDLPVRLLDKVESPPDQHTFH
jgi:hypothetical protein